VPSFSLSDGPGDALADDRLSVSILIADDDRDARDSLRELLELSGYRIHYAVDGTEALNLAQTLKSDIVFLDIQMLAPYRLTATHLDRGSR
jgi:CheY-like chemotaxis protein